MSITITNASKNTLTISNESKTEGSQTWAERFDTWGDTGPAGDTWAIAGTVIAKESKNSISMSNEAKN